MVSDYVHHCAMYKLKYYTVYNQQGYVDLVGEAAEASMKEAIEEVASLSHYASDGEVLKSFPLHCTN